MKKFWLMLCLSLVVLAGADAVQYTRVVSSRIVALPAAASKSLTAWVTNTAYAQGALRLNTNNGMTYMALDGGTSAVSGVGPMALGEVTDNTVTWIPVATSIRRTWIIQNYAGGDVTVQFDPTSTTNGDGHVLVSGGSISQDGVDAIAGMSGTALDPASVWQGAIFLVSTGATVKITEW